MSRIAEAPTLLTDRAAVRVKNGHGRPSQVSIGQCVPCACYRKVVGKLTPSIQVALRHTCLVPFPCRYVDGTIDISSLLHS